MKRCLFVMTHLGSDWQLLQKHLNNHPDIECYHLDHSYHHPDDLKTLTGMVHKRNTASAIWCDVILHNKDFTCRKLCESCLFLYWVRPFDKYHKELLPLGQNAILYYEHRIECLKQYFRRTSKSVWNPSLDFNSSSGAIPG